MKATPLRFTDYFTEYTEEEIVGTHKPRAQSRGKEQRRRADAHTDIDAQPCVCIHEQI